MDAFPVIGVITNMPFLRKAIRHPAFTSGNYDTRFVGMYGELTTSGEASPIDAAAIHLAEQFWQANVPKRLGNLANPQERPQGPWDAIRRTSFP